MITLTNISSPVSLRPTLKTAEFTLTSREGYVLETLVTELNF